MRVVSTLVLDVSKLPDPAAKEEDNAYSDLS